MEQNKNNFFNCRISQLFSCKMHYKSLMIMPGLNRAKEVLLKKINEFGEKQRDFTRDKQVWSTIGESWETVIPVVLQRKGGIWKQRFWKKAHWRNGSSKWWWLLTRCTREGSSLLSAQRKPRCFPLDVSRLPWACVHAPQVQCCVFLKQFLKHFYKKLYRLKGEKKGILLSQCIWRANIQSIILGNMQL